MNNRIAKKILSYTSSLHKNEQKVLAARNQYFNNEKWFLKQGIYLISIEIDNRCTLPVYIKE